MPELTRFTLQWRRLQSQLWFRPAVSSVAAIVCTTVAYSADSWLPADWVPKLEPDVVEDLLRILATSMLAVSTFASAASAGTPRATGLVVSDPRAQSSVAVFLGSFIFSIVGVVALGIGVWGRSARFVLFVFALLVLCWVIYAFMQYLQLLTRIGRVGHTIETVEGATRRALEARARRPLGGATAAASPPDGARPVLAEEVGHVQLVDMRALEELCIEHDVSVHLATRTGDLVHPAAPLLFVRSNGERAAQQEDREVAPPSDGAQEGASAQLDGDFVKRARHAFVIGRQRTVEQDASYGLIVLGEIAQRALSPGINDPGTAIAVIGSQTRLLVQTLARDDSEPLEDDDEDDDDARCPHVFAEPVDPGAVVQLAFDPIARAGANVPEVQQQLLRHLAVLARCGSRTLAPPAREQAHRCLQRARGSNMDPGDLAALERVHREEFPDSER
jgi:uncharacterized membrane protein